MRHLFFVHYKHTDVGILILHMNKTNEASILLKSEKKTRQAAFETGEGGPEKLFFDLALFVWFFFYLASPFSDIVRLI